MRGVLIKNYGRRELATEYLGSSIDLFNKQELARPEYNGLDVLCRGFECMLSRFASAEGKLGGEFFSPRGVVQLLVEMLEPFSGRVYDRACESGGMFVQTEEFVRTDGGQRNDISVFGQERSSITWRLAKMNLALRGIAADLGSQWPDFFTKDVHPDLHVLERFCIDLP